MERAKPVNSFLERVSNLRVSESLQVRLGGQVKDLVQKRITQASKGEKTDLQYLTRLSSDLGPKGEKIDVAHWSRTGSKWYEAARSTVSVSDGGEYVLHGMDEVFAKDRAKIVAKFGVDGALTSLLAGRGEDLKPLQEVDFFTQLRLSAETGLVFPVAASVWDYLRSQTDTVRSAFQK